MKKEIEKTIKAQKEIDKILQKYNCKIVIDSKARIIPDEMIKDLKD